MKVYVLIISKKFPHNHVLKGEPTNFEYHINHKNKIHTIRSNYDFWHDRIEEVRQGKAVLSVRVWTGKPYHSPQRQVAQFTATNNVGIQKIDITFEFSRCAIHKPEEGGKTYVPTYRIAENDGLSLGSFESWFQNQDLSKPFAIIHFTKMRY